MSKTARVKVGIMVNARKKYLQMSNQQIWGKVPCGQTPKSLPTNSLQHKLCTHSPTLWEGGWKMDEKLLTEYRREEAYDVLKKGKSCLSSCMNLLTPATAPPPSSVPGQHIKGDWQLIKCRTSDNFQSLVKQSIAFKCCSHSWIRCITARVATCMFYYNMPCWI